MKHGWEYKKAAEVCTVVTDYVANGSFATLRENVQYKNEKDYAVLVRLADYTNDFDIEKFVYVNKHAYDFLAKSTLYGGEIIMSNVGSVGKSFICPDLGVPMTLAPNSILIRTTNNPFYFYYFKSNTFLRQLNSITSKTALPKFNKTEFKKLLFPVPPLPVQEQICSLLDKLSLVIEKKKQQVKELDNLAQAIFYDMFGDPVENDKGWETKQLGDCFTYIKNGVNIKQDKTQSGLPITRIETLSNGVFNRDRMGYAGITDIVKYQQYILNDKDLLMSHINSKAYIGRTVMYAKKGDETIIHGMNLLRLVPVEDLESVFFCYMTKSDYFKKKIANIRKDAVNQSSFAISDLKKIAVPIPPLPLQQSFAQKVEAIERQKELINQSIREAQTLFDSRMEYYFGE